jgi:anionic cell wall polymer biosynthesis LytR-Cps2A-Psr (LCP) family protein
LKQLKFDKSILFLLIILVVLAGVGTTAVLFLRTDVVKTAIENDQILKSLFVVESGGKALGSYVFLYYPATRRAAIFDIPAETGLIISSLKKVAGIGVLFKPNDPVPYRNEISKLLSTDLSLHFVLSLEAFGEIVDLMDGLELFIPNPVELDVQGSPVLFPQGVAMFDGDKVKNYFSYEDPNEAENDAVTRRQKAFIAFLTRISERSDYLSKPEVLSRFQARFRTNAGKEAMKRFIGALSGLDAERVTPSRVQGTSRNVEGKTLIFPHYDGELLKDIVRQNLNALANSETSGGGERIFTLEIRNGTAVKGLAKRAASLYESFGYEVLAFGNAETEDNAETVLIDRFGNGDAAADVAQVIKCPSVAKPGLEEKAAEGGADFVLVLGKDFNGRYCVR